MASPSELSLDCKPPAHHNSYSLLLKSFSDQPDPTQKLEDFLSRLEEERLKIDVFKRELPLCMQLLTNAVEASRQQLQSYREKQGANRPVLEEFIPIKQSTSDGSEQQQQPPSSNISDKANWMTTAQLWSQPNNDIGIKPAPQSSKDTDTIGFNIISPKLASETNKQRSVTGGAFLPFSKDRNSPNSTLRSIIPDLALSSSDKQIEEKKCYEGENNNNSNNIMSNMVMVSCEQQGKGSVGNHLDAQILSPASAAANTSTTTTNTTQTTHRKARRCWSPELHRRFVNALQILGGSQVATPKQIRELMKVDGLTNDEVKSHLQKYRLHTRRPSPSPQAAGAPPPQLVVLGGIWVPPEYATAAAAAAHGGASALYSPHPSSHAPPHYCAQPVPQEYYTAQPPPSSLHHPLHHHALHHSLHIYKATSQTQSSPESDVRGTGDRSESIEDGKSESNSWKAESGDNGGGERKGLAALRQEGEQNNGSEITLNF